MYNKVEGSGGILPRENLNFQSLRNAIFGLLALMFALLQMPVSTKLKGNFLVTPPLHTVFFWLAPPLKPYFFAWPPLKSHQPPYLIKNERSLISQQLVFEHCSVVKRPLYNYNNYNQEKKKKSFKNYELECSHCKNLFYRLNTLKKSAKIS